MWGGATAWRRQRNLQTPRDPDGRSQVHRLRGSGDIRESCQP